MNYSMLIIGNNMDNEGIGIDFILDSLDLIVYYAYFDSETFKLCLGKIIKGNVI